MSAVYVFVNWEEGGRIKMDAIKLKKGQDIYDLIDKFVDARVHLIVDPADVRVYKSNSEIRQLQGKIPDHYFYDPSVLEEMPPPPPSPPPLWMKVLRKRVRPEAEAAFNLGLGFPPRTSPKKLLPTPREDARQSMSLTPGSKYSMVGSARSSTPILKYPSNTPSVEPGKAEGLKHASVDGKNYMQATSHFACIKLLEIYDGIRKQNMQAELDRNSMAESVLHEIDKAKASTDYVTRVLKEMKNRRRKYGDSPADADDEISKFFTGAMVVGIGNVLHDGHNVLHQAFTHSDLSVCKLGRGSWPRTLMVGEGKTGDEWDLRVETRGQILNELMRHRKNDERMNKKSSYKPILLLAFNQRLVEIDLAFPCKKLGKLENNGFVGFASLPKNTETFCTVPLLRISIADANATKNLPHLFRFLAAALEYLSEYKYGLRLNGKMPLIEDADRKVRSYTVCGDNVTIIDFRKGPKRVYKEYCYHLREDNETETGMLADLHFIEDRDHRKPPPRELLKKLGSPYKYWKVKDGPLGTSVLRYNFIEGSSKKPTVKGWLMILNQIQIMHREGYVHGDLLPQNVIFTPNSEGYVIDFDLARKENEPYVSGLNFRNFSGFRHPDTAHGGKMKKDHDVHALRRMSGYYFYGSLDNKLGVANADSTLDNLIEKKCTLEQLTRFFSQCSMSRSRS